MAAYPALWFNDSFDYARIALAPAPSPLRPDGYGFVLWALRPLHSFAVVVACQHLLGLATGIMVYALLHHRFRLAGWLASLAAAPVLLDAYELELEHLVMSDVVFMFLVTGAVTVMLWRPAISWQAGAAAGALLALAALTRTVALPLIVLLAAFLVVRRVRWRPVAVTLLATVTPLAAYALWFQSATGHLGLTDTDGIFLWGRTAAFANCAVIKPPPDLASLCPRLPPGERAASSSQIWQVGSPIGWSTHHAFSAATNDRALRFAMDAIIAQPLGYASAVRDGLVLTFDWNRHPYPTPYTAGLYRFPATTGSMPASPTLDPALVHTYTGTSFRGRVTEPFAHWLRQYQRHIFLRGPMLAVVLGLGLAGIRRHGADAALAWAIAVSLVTVPLLTTDFDYRYTLPAIPVACIAAALAGNGPRVREWRAEREVGVVEELRGSRLTEAPSS